MARKLIILCALGLTASIYAGERSGAEPSDPEPVEVEKAESADADSSLRSRLTLSPQNRSVKDLHVEATTGGALKVDLEGRFQHALVLKIAPDGSRSVECVDDHRQERSLLELAPQSSIDEDPQED